MFKVLTFLALASIAIVTDATIPVDQGPAEYIADADGHIPIREEPDEYREPAEIDTDLEPIEHKPMVNITNGLTFENIEPTNRQLQEGEAVVAALQVAASVAPIIADIFKGNRKDCQQCACWISTNSRPCALSVAEKVQDQVMLGRDRFGYESIQSNGMWVRYWRTKFEPVDRGDIASGTCTDGATFTVTNCMTTGRVHC